MKFDHLGIENFLTIKDASLQLNDKGLILVQGENEDDSSADSNGAGKSSIPDALCWAIYGKTARGESGDSVINRQAGKNTRVRTILRDDTGRWVITRHRKYKGKSNRLELLHITAEGDHVDHTKGTDKLTQVAVDKVVGSSYEVFAASVYAGQEAMPDLPAMTDKQLKGLVEEAAGITRLQAAYEVARSKMRDAEGEMTRLADFIRLKVGEAKRIGEEVQALTEKSEGYAEEHHRRYVSASKEVKQAKADFEKIEAKVAALKEESDKALERIKAVDAEIAESEGRVSEYHRLFGEESRAVAAQTVAESESNKAREAAKAARKSISSINDKIDTPCPSCGKPITAEDMEEVRGIEVEKLKALVEDFKALEHKRARVNEVAVFASKALEECKASLPDNSALLTERGTLMRKIDEADGAEDTLRLYADAVTGAEKRFAGVKDEANPYEELVEAAKEKKAEAVRVAKAEKAKSDEQAKKLAVLKEAVAVFGPAGVRAHILDTVTPYLNDRTAHYLGTLSDGNITAIWNTIGETAAGELREKFNIEVTSETGADKFGGLSGGEKRKVRLSVAMALQDLVASRASKPLELFIADEVDHALDGAGLERLMGLLNEKATERGTVLVISHNSLSDWIRDTIRVVKRDGGSFVEGVIAS